MACSASWPPIAEPSCYIGAVTGRAAFSLLPLLLASVLAAAETAADAAHELVRRIPGGVRNPVSLAVQNLSDLGANEVAEVRRALEGDLRIESGAPDEIRVTISQNFAGYLLVAEVKRGEQRQVAMVSWTRAAGTSPARTAAVTVEKTRIAALADPILDAVKIDSDWLVLQPGRVVRLSGASATFPPLPLPRDPRGRLVVQGGSYLAYLSGYICSGAVEPLDARCREADEPWPLPVRATMARGRNYFETRQTKPATFYATAEGIFTRLDGRAYLQESPMDWGSDLAAVKCGGASVVLATRPGEGSEKDVLRVYHVVEGQAAEAAPPIDLPGPVTALWPAGEDSAVVVARDLGSGEYAAYRLAVSCRH